MSVILALAKIIPRVRTLLVTSCARVNRVTLEKNVTPTLMSVKTNLVSTMARVMTSLTTTLAPAHKGSKDSTATKKSMSVPRHLAPRMPPVRISQGDTNANVSLVSLAVFVIRTLMNV